MSLIQQIYDVVSEMYQKHEKLLELAGQKKDVLVRGDMDQLQQIVVQENVLVRELGKLEDLRAKIGNALSQEYHVELDQITLSWIEQRTNPIERYKIHTLADRYEGLIKDLQATNEQNGKLIEQSLHYVNYMVDLVSGNALMLDSNYGPNTQDPSSKSTVRKSNSIFDRRV